MKIKITTGFDADQKFTIEIEEAHKAYYLFRNPEKRGVFSNGVALTGKDIKSIQPDWNATMGWNSTHELDDDDWNEIRLTGIDTKLNNLLGKAQSVSLLVDKNPNFMLVSLSEVLKEIPKENEQISEGSGLLADKFKV